ncbi:hypothetical protein [Thermophilibacter provencensis]|uniref:hypothetical protein n=1 Tax=Thermophilibacter provencensis TaxID=1852386 RepID=UPI003AA80E83
MRIEKANGGADRFTLTCDEGELALIAEGLYAVENTGRRCLADDIPDEVDRPGLEAEVARLAEMRVVLMPALGEEPVFRVIRGGRR